jgi:hypothetical protein
MTETPNRGLDRRARAVAFALARRGECGMVVAMAERSFDNSSPEDNRVA